MYLFSFLILFVFVQSKNVELRLVLKLQNIEDLAEKFWRLADDYHSELLSHEESIEKYSAGLEN